MLTCTASISRIRSFVKRDGRATPGQARAFTHLWSQMGLELSMGILNPQTIFGNSNPVYLEIGFGRGHSLLAAAQANPDKNFIGIETYRPGIGALFLGIEKLGLTNIRVFFTDAVDVLERCIAAQSLTGMQIFFPDPWPKRRHHPRRLLQTAFVNQLAQKLIAGGQLHVATDWEDYAKQMLQVLEGEPLLKNAAGKGQFSTRSCMRPVVTKFEQSALHAGRQIFELQFVKD